MLQRILQHLGIVLDRGADDRIDQDFALAADKEGGRDRRAGLGPVKVRRHLSHHVDIAGILYQLLRSLERILRIQAQADDLAVLL